jgi:hypothetical protein
MVPECIGQERKHVFTHFTGKSETPDKRNAGQAHACPARSNSNIETTFPMNRELPPSPAFEIGSSPA